MSEISIIVPVYKSEQVIRRCIDSILRQTFADFELLLIDDGSPDNSGSICDEYAAIDKRIKVVHQCNCGVSAARNTGLGLANGKYILFIDSDDYVCDDYVSQLCAQKSDLTICGLIVQNECEEQLYSIIHNNLFYVQRKDIDYARLYKEYALYSPYCKLFSSTIIKSNNLRFPQNVSWGEDSMFVADYLQHVDSVRVIDYAGYMYVKYEHESSLSTSVREDVVDMIAWSRTYCCKKMESTSPDFFEEVKVICEEDLKRNIAYFVRRLMEHTTLTRKKKIGILQKYMHSPYVSDIFSNVAVYFPGEPIYQIALAKPHAAAIIRVFSWEKKKQILLGCLYKVYDIQPKIVKCIFRRIKSKVKK